MQKKEFGKHLRRLRSRAAPGIHCLELALLIVASEAPNTGRSLRRGCAYCTLS